MTQDKVQGTAKIDVDNGLFTPVHDPAVKRLNLKDITEIRSSPYHDKDHWLQLNTLEENYKVIALALQSFQPIVEDYAFQPYQDSFNIDVIIDLIKQYSLDLNYDFPTTEAYVIAFRSILHEPVQKSVENREFLGKIDKESHLEANESGGLIKYWFGVPDDSTGQNLATCWWTTREHAKRGGGGPSHRQGMSKVKGWYKYWKVEEYKLTIHENVTSYTFEKII
ncbi:uncharacterized protein RJT21DRAFT_49361 [Scheffersomyces amazonensis]|uniref:uncharacterized protein n=1 Tax=Scheffersomyces amazonensis TaxID=1078765 RepID=UPI00315D8A1F